MSAMDDTTTLGRARVSFAKQSDIEEFADTLAKFERGEIGPDQWRVFRLLRGTYGQRQPDVSHADHGHPRDARLDLLLQGLGPVRHDRSPSSIGHG